MTTQTGYILDSIVYINVLLLVLSPRGALYAI